jgi:LacI family transcriptional regulator
MKNVTMKDVAKKAGVSLPTVSEVLNNRRTFASQATRERVQKIARQLNYQPNFLARSLKMGKTKCIGLMGSLAMANLNFPYFQDTIASVENSLVKLTDQYSLNIFGANYNETYKKSIELIRKGIVEGLLLIILAIDLKKFAEKLKPVLDDCRLPFVVIHSTSQTLGFNNVGLDSFYGGYLAGDHLGRLGHKEVWVYALKGDMESPQTMEIIRGFKKGLADHGASWPEQNVIWQGHPEACHTFHAAYRTMLEVKTVPSALFVSDNEAAAGVLRALDKRGVRVPQETAVISFNNAKSIPYCEEELSTVIHPVEQKAEQAVALLLDILEGRKSTEAVHQTIIKPWLEVKESCGGKKIVNNSRQF